MNNTEMWLGLAVVFAGLWSGLLLTLTTILHPIYAAQDARGFRQELGRFLPVARRSPTNYILVIGLVVAPTAALITLRHESSELPFQLTAIGLTLTVIGPLMTSRYLAEPNYDVILGWDPDSVPAGWKQTRRTYFALNWVRGALTWAAFGAFLAAAYSYLR
jgi:hypothetical protein